MKLLNETDFETAEGYEAYVIVLLAHTLNPKINSGMCYEIALDHLLEHGGLSPSDAIMLAKWFTQTEKDFNEH